MGKGCLTYIVNIPEFFLAMRVVTLFFEWTDLTKLVIPANTRLEPEIRNHILKLLENFYYHGPGLQPKKDP